jgi:hypothetical protein
VSSVTVTSAVLSSGSPGIILMVANIVGGHSGGGGSRDSGGRWLYNQRFNYWLWPLHPEGPLALVCEWPIADIPETRTEIDSALVRNAAAETMDVWPENENEASAESETSSSSSGSTG